MTTTLAPSATRSNLTFAGILRSELIKLLSLRSTVWCFAIVIVLTVGLAALAALTIPSALDGLGPVPSQPTWVQTATLGIAFAQLVVAVLGVLAITGEYSTGMIRSTMTAVPRRTPALAAKAIVIGLSTFVVGLVALGAAAVLSGAILSGAGLAVDFGDPAIAVSMVGAAGYLALIAVLSLAIGTTVRNSPAGITSALGLILVLPVVLSIFAALTRSEFARNIGAFLPDSSAAGGRIYAYPTPADAIPAPGSGAGIVVLEPWQGLVVVLIWVGVASAAAVAMLKSRDV